MTPQHMHASAANSERFRTEEDDSVLLSRLRFLIYALGIAAAFVAVTVYRYLGEL